MPSAHRRPLLTALSMSGHGTASCNAIDATTGQLRWKVQVDCQSTVVPLPKLAVAQRPAHRAQAVSKHPVESSRHQRPLSMAGSTSEVDERFTALLQATGECCGSTSSVETPRTRTARRTRTTLCKFFRHRSCPQVRYTLAFRRGV